MEYARCSLKNICEIRREKKKFYTENELISILY